METFRRAADIAPTSQDVRLYLALHYARGREWARAVPLLEQVLAESPERVPALEALALAREREGRLGDSVALRQRLFALRPASPAELVQLGRVAMGAQQTDVAIGAFERAKAAQGAAFAQHLELGVLYLAARRLDDARRALGRGAGVAPRARDGAVQAGAGQRAAERARPCRPHRRRAPRRRCHHARA